MKRKAPRAVKEIRSNRVSIGYVIARVVALLRTLREIRSEYRLRKKKTANPSAHYERLVGASQSRALKRRWRRIKRAQR